MELNPPPLRLSAPAFDLWRDLYNDIEIELGRGGEFQALPDIGAKVAENAARIAGLFHLFEAGPTGSVEVVTMDACAFR